MHSTRIKLDRGGVSLIVTTEDTGGQPYEIRVIDENRRLWYWRRVRDNDVTINLPTHPRYVWVITSRGSVRSILQSKLTPPSIPYPDKPTHSRPYSPDQIRIKKNTTIHSPARMFKDRPLIEYNPNKLKNYPEPVKRFILYHEVGHLFFDDEVKADRWATITFLNKGWNLSTAIYALTQILGRSEENVMRMIEQNDLLKNLSQRYYG